MKKNTLESLNDQYQESAKIILIAAGMDRDKAIEQTTIRIIK